MNKVHTSAVVIVPPREIWGPIQAIRRKHDKKLERWMPHINLFYPFAHRGAFDEMKELYMPQLGTIHPFDLTLRKFKYFEHGYSTFTLWLKPEPVEKVVTLQHELLRVDPQYDDVNRFKGGYTPHLSLGQVRTHTKLVRIIKRLKQDWDPLTFTVKEIHFISRKNNKKSSFSIQESLPLG